MLRITIHDEPGILTFQLEGKLTGPWVRELEACWHRTLAERREPVHRFDLTGVTLIDAVGKAFLATAHERGAKFVAAGCFMRAIVAQITHSAIAACDFSKTSFSETKTDHQPREGPT